MGGLLGLTLLLGGFATVHSQDEGTLPPGPGRDEAELYCSPCHSLKIVTQQGLSREDWDELLVWMVDEQGMAEIIEADRKIVLDYLADQISVERVREMRRQR